MKHIFNVPLKIILSTSFIIFVTTSIIFIHILNTINKNSIADLKKNAQRSLYLVDFILHDKLKELKTMTSGIADKNSVRAALSAGNVQITLAKNLKEDASLNKLALIYITDKDGIVYSRQNNPLKFGDTLIDHPYIKKGLEGTTSAGIEIMTKEQLKDEGIINTIRKDTPDGIMLKVTTPVYDQNRYQILGTVTTMILLNNNLPLIEFMKNIAHCEIMIQQENGKVILNSFIVTPKKSKPIKNEIIYTKLELNNMIYFMAQRHIKNAENQNIGILSVFFPEIPFILIRINFIRQALLIFSFYMIVIIIVLARFSHRMNKPLKNLLNKITKTKNGNFNLKTKVKINDDIDLQQREAYFRSLIENASGLILVLDTQAHILYTSPSVENTLGYKPKEMLNKNIFDFIHPHDTLTVKDIFKKGIENPGQIQEIILNYRHKNNSWRFLEGTSKNLFADPTVKGTVLTLRDFSERKETEKAMRLIQLGKLVANIAHEVNNPLMIISGEAQLSLMENIENEQLNENLKIIINQCERAKGITQRMLKFARPSKGEPKETNIIEIIEPVIKILEHQYSLNNIKIIRNYMPALPKIIIDEKYIEEVMMNLLSNASDAMPHGGTITITTATENTSIKIEINDTGCGISEENMKSLFTPFFTTKEKGTGLGLSVSYGIITSYGGNIKIKSNENKGTTVTIILPVEKTRNDI